MVLGILLYIWQAPILNFLKDPKTLVTQIRVSKNLKRKTP